MLKTTKFLSVFNFKKKQYEICLIGFYFCQSRKATNVDRWNRVIDWLSKNNKENRLIVLIGDANQNTLYDENSKQPTASATQSSSRIILNGIKSIFEVLNLKQILQPNAEKKLFGHLRN